MVAQKERTCVECETPLKLVNKSGYCSKHLYRSPLVKERQQQYQQSEAGKTAAKKYDQSEKGREKRRALQRSPEGKERSRESYRKNREKILSRNRKYRQSPEGGRRFKSSRMKAKYGISLDEVEALLEKQNGLCAICQQPEQETIRGKYKQLAIDHDHKTGRIRGLLCANCNQGLGRFEDDPARLLAAVQYIQTRASKQ
ncbi:hypothetical protein LCGC14_1583510 [marine sediment metagenome]|uniref:Recombination endonuclease VII n=1 Tax=marine sediment metagenome TaxID=412755 RepID=A0A0F9LGE3_9ZZZZ